MVYRPRPVDEQVSPAIIHSNRRKRMNGSRGRPGERAKTGCGWAWFSHQIVRRKSAAVQRDRFNLRQFSEMPAAAAGGHPLTTECRTADNVGRRAPRCVVVIFAVIVGRIYLVTVVRPSITYARRPDFDHVNRSPFDR